VAAPWVGGHTRGGKQCKAFSASRFKYGRAVGYNHLVVVREIEKRTAARSSNCGESRRGRAPNAAVHSVRPQEAGVMT